MPYWLIYWLTLLALAAALAGCASTGMTSPNDPESARTGAPRGGGGM